MLKFLNMFWFVLQLDPKQSYLNFKMGSVLLHTLNGVLHTKRRRAKNDLTLHTVCKIFKEKKLKIGKI